MGVEAAVRSLLLADAAVAAIVAGRIYPQYLPDGSGYPSIVYQKISVSRSPHLSGPTDLVESRLQLDLWARKYSESRDLADAVRRSLNGYRGTASGVLIKATRLSGERDLYDSDVDVHRVSADFIIFHDEVV